LYSNIEPSFLRAEDVSYPEFYSHLNQQAAHRTPPTQPDLQTLDLAAHVGQLNLQSPKTLQIFVAEVPQQPEPVGAFLHWLNTMVGKKSGKALLREEGTMAPFGPSHINETDPFSLCRPRTNRQWHEAVELARTSND
jgi:hypothetical protein